MWHAFEYSIRRKKIGETPQMTKPEHAEEWLRPLFDGLEYEKMFVAALDTKRQMVSLEEVSSGGLSNANFFPRDVFRLACRSNASAIVVAHNHPSGDPTPSPQDLVVTQQLIDAGHILGIKVVDHLIFGEKTLSLRLDERLIWKKGIDKKK